MTSKAHRVAFVSGHTFGQQALQGLLSSTAYLNGAVEVPLVFGLPGKHRLGTVGYVNVLETVGLDGARLAEATDPTLEDHLDMLENEAIDVLMVIGWSRLVAPSVLNAVPLCIGMHPTDLPRGRGQAPIPWTIIKGLDRSALSVFQLQESPDAGEIIAKYPFAVRPRETATSLFHRVAHLHFGAGLELGEKLASGAVHGEEQPEHAATRWPRRKPDDGLISADLTVLEADALVRALRSPYPPAFLWVEGVRRSVVATALGSYSGNLEVLRMRFADGELDLYLGEI